MQVSAENWHMPILQKQANTMNTDTLVHPLFRLKLTESRKMNRIGLKRSMVQYIVATISAIVKEQSTYQVFLLFVVFCSILSVSVYRYSIVLIINPQKNGMCFFCLFFTDSSHR